MLVFFERMLCSISGLYFIFSLCFGQNRAFLTDLGTLLFSFPLLVSCVHSGAYYILWHVVLVLHSNVGAVGSCCYLLKSEPLYQDKPKG